jgi:ornithine cyclodeaminase/alanine dehydrogenase-like protein (mu-crystallin family)
MARKPKSLFDLVDADNRRRQAHLERELQTKNRTAALSILGNAAVLQAGATRNALSGILPLVTANDQRQRRGRK